MSSHSSSISAKDAVSPTVVRAGPATQTGPSNHAQPVKLSLIQHIWQGLCSFVAVIFGLKNKTHNSFKKHAEMAPTSPMRALQKPAALNAAPWPFCAKNDSPFAQYPQFDVIAPWTNKTPDIIRCGSVAYKAKWYTDDKAQSRIHYEDAETLAYNRALFVAHTKKLLTRGGMQASRPQIHAAADLYQVNIVIWSRDMRSADPWSVVERVEPAAGAAAKTVDLCLYMEAGEGSHYRVLMDVAPIESQPGLTISLQASVVEAGSEGECLYLALGWALNRADARLVRLEYNALRAAGRAPGSYVAFFKSRSDMLTQMHAEISLALLAPEYAERIDAEVQDAIQMKLRQLAKRA